MLGIERKNTMLEWVAVVMLCFMTFGLIALIFWGLLIGGKANVETFSIIMWCTFGGYWVVIMVAWSFGIKKREVMKKQMIEKKLE